MPDVDHIHSRLHLLIVALAVLTLGTAGAVWLAVSTRPSADGLPSPVLSTLPTQALTKTGVELDILKLGVAVPIILDVPGNDEKAYLKATENGVAHYAGTAVPGTTGNSFLFGHSSYYKNKPGNFKEVFRELDKLAVGDTFDIRKDGQTLTYRVKRSAIIPETDLSVLDPTETETVTLMTCWPPGTIAKRYVVQADRIDGETSQTANNF